MTAIANPTIALDDIGLRGRVANLIQRLQDERARRAIYRQTVRELSELSLRDLDDLGISRAMIQSLAYEAAWGKAK
ncbi:DUF1127 domain-containing protein [Paracoccus caeni]|uniref:DUF1127 domain-containing protein n=1 Tax=Paracoccus caeni TaxID=657651 RepID=A0A934SGL0_9RHOB|nr:DUF1127 domain-containing protein [Paracoccus caeni]MBK4216656.1 DUF1127 domain-containing protein [Paracoccus caeni]